MQNNLLIIAGALLLTGCVTAPTIQTVIQKVEVPIAVPCEAVIPEPPRFNFDALTIDQNLLDKSKAILADRKLHQGYEGELLSALKSCK